MSASHSECPSPLGISRKTTTHAPLPGATNGVMTRGMTIVFYATFAWAILLAFLCLHTNWRYVYDDTFITLRYARHLAQGHGPRWNLSGTTVEGFSSPLHMLLLAALATAHIPLIASARLVGFASHALLLLFLWRFTARRDGRMAAALVCALVIASWTILVWDLGGLESPLFAAMLAMGTLLTLDYIETGQRREIVMGGVLLGLALFTRPDGSVVASVALLASLLLGRAANLPMRLADVALAAAACALVVMPWEIFRLAYYHAALPNTYYAKIVGIPLDWRQAEGIQYWDLYIRCAPNLPLIALLAALGVLLNRKCTRFDAALWACIAAYGFFVIDCGGDHMMAFRLMAPLVPLMALSVVRGTGQIGGLKTAGRAAAVSLLLAFASARQIYAGADNPVYRDWAGLMGEDIGHYIATHWAPGSLVGVDVAGTTAYFADNMNFIDMLGLNDREIARRDPVPLNLPTVREIGHMKGDGASVLARRPNYIIPIAGNGPLLKTNDMGHYLGEYELSGLPDFWRLYEPCELTLSASQDAGPYAPKSFEFIFYQRRDMQTSCPVPH